MNPLRFGLRPFWLFFCAFTFFAGVDFVSAQGLLITEFQAFNESTIQDEDSEYTDWIEIFNSGDAEVNLEGYYLTDSVEDLNKWQFPAVTIGPGRFLVVFASGKDRRRAGSELHTNFSIERNGGEILVLITPDGSSVVSGYTEIPEQIEDASYGMATDSVLPNRSVRARQLAPWCRRTTPSVIPGERLILTTAAGPRAPPVSASRGVRPATRL